MMAAPHLISSQVADATSAALSNLDLKLGKTPAKFDLLFY